ncbi:MAG: RHS repeat-associated core domain-containing protein [Planctomycetales bacterium]|nr:RHS repeat-associated core domain-containing protein [Planctomycetales bacterium]
MFRVNLATGDLCLAVAGWMFPTALSLELSRAYSTATPDAAPLGPHWKLWDPEYLDEQGSQISFHSGGQAIAQFESVGAPPADGDAFSIAIEANGQYLVTDRQQGKRYRLSKLGLPQLQVELTDRYGNTMVRRYDVRGQLVELIDSDQRKFRLTYAADRLTEIVLVAGSSTETDETVLACEYDTLGQLVRTRDWPNVVREYQYVDGKMVRFTNPLGGTHFAAFDDTGRCRTVWEQDGVRSYAYEYDTERRQTTLRNRNGHVQLFRFNEQNALIESVNPLGASRQLLRDIDGSLIAELGPDGSVIGSWHVATGENQVTQLDPLGAVTIIQFNDDGAIKSVTDVAENQWTYEYDERGDVATALTPAGSWQFEYAPQGDLHRVVDAGGGQLKITHENRHRRTTVVDAANQTEKLEYDRWGRLVKAYNGRGWGYDIEYSGGTHELRFSDKQYERFTYDVLNNLTQYEDAIGRRWRYHYDAFGRMIEATDPLQKTVKYSYDCEGRIEQVANEAHVTFTTAYDAAGKIVQQTDFGHSSRQYVYDATGKLRQIVTGDGKQIAVDTDAASQMVGLDTETAGYQRNAFDQAGRRTRIETAGATLEFAYDALGRVVQEVVDGDAVDYSYGWHELPVEIKTKRRRVNYNYDVAKNLCTASDDRGLQINFQEDPATLTTTADYGSGWQVSRRYDERSHLIEQVVRRNGSEVIGETYRYDAAGNLLERVRRGGERLEFTHSSRRELVECRLDGVVARRYRYDDAGNITETINGDVEYLPGNRLRQWSGAEIKYDGDGRPVEKISDSERCSYEFDFAGQIVEARRAEGVSSYTYDGIARRLKWSTPLGSGTTRWACDWLLDEVHEDGTQLAYVVHPIRQVVLAVAIDNIWYLVVTDQHGEATDLLNMETGQSAWKSLPMGFDSQVVHDHLQGHWRVRGIGQIADPDSELIYQRARYYVPEIGRFFSPDPLSVAAGWNVYSYCLNQPLRYIDPTGLCPTLSESDCSQLRNNIRNRATSVETRWQEMQTPVSILPWSTPPALPKGGIYAAPILAADNSVVPAGSKSKGSLETHIDAYQQEQKGLKRTMQEYHAGGCREYETPAERAEMRAMGKWQNKKIELPTYPLKNAPPDIRAKLGI